MARLLLVAMVLDEGRLMNCLMMAHQLAVGCNEWRQASVTVSIIVGIELVGTCRATARLPYYGANKQEQVIAARTHKIDMLIIIGRARCELGIVTPPRHHVLIYVRKSIPPSP
jgi:hypothetical protein